MYCSEMFINSNILCNLCPSSQTRARSWSHTGHSLLNVLAITIELVTNYFNEYSVHVTHVIPQRSSNKDRYMRYPRRLHWKCPQFNLRGRQILWHTQSLKSPVCISESLRILYSKVGTIPELPGKITMSVTEPLWPQIGSLTGLFLGRVLELPYLQSYRLFKSHLVWLGLCSWLSERATAVHVPLYSSHQKI